MSEEKGPPQSALPQRVDPLSTINADALESGIVGLLAKAIKDNNAYSAVGLLQDLFERVRDRKASADHVRQMELLSKSDTIAFAEYVGLLGETETGLEELLGRVPRPDEKEGLLRGYRRRNLEIRAIELDRARSGGKIEPWMKR